MKNTLRTHRKARGWTQADLAQRLAVSRQTVNALEAERYDPSLPLAFRIAHLFEVAIEDIFVPGEEG
jgi:putative transcriptional regulator